MRTRVVIQSRLDSSRLPGKAMLTIAGMPLIELVARRAARSGHEVVVATSEERFDDRIATHLESVGIPVVRGPLDDVLGRFVLATTDLAPDDRVVRLTGDNPVADADLVDELLAAMDVSGHTYGRVDVDQVPEGLGAEGFTAAALRRAASEATAPYDREHVTPWLRRELGELLFVPKANPGDRFRYRATVDVLSDYDRAVRVFEGESDPVSVPWATLMSRLGSLTAGQRVPVRPGATMSRLVLGVDGGADQGPSGSAARALVGTAVESGITHVELAGGNGAAERSLREGMEPAFARRLGVLMRVARPEPGIDPALAFEAQVERRLAVLGRRQVTSLVLDGVTADDAGAAVWRRAGEYVTEGVAELRGASVSSRSELLAAYALTGLGLVRLTGAATAAYAEEADLRARAREAGLVVLVAPDLAQPLDTGKALGLDGVTAVVRTVDSATAVTDAVTEVAALPGRPER